ncbi:MAG: prepilin-type N-terminal cleavage/methylation domain-containing protein [Patescibacteria group bacterium]|nr:prepilin-type N-terminal cleavage/methylation domain-containing protein [Patescibacteria group bacterium]
MDVRTIKRGSGKREAGSGKHFLRGFMTSDDLPHQKGFSLMESITVLGVMAMLLIIIAQIFIVSYDIYAKQTAKADNSTSAVLAARAISESTRGATEVLDTGTINSTVYTSSDDELVLKLPAIDGSGNIIVDSYDYIAFYRDGTDTTKIFSDIESDASSYRFSGQKLVTAYNEAMNFRYNNPTIADASRVSIYIRNAQVVRQANLEAEAWTSIFLRNR